MIYYNMIGRGFPLYERPLEPPDGYYDTDDEDMEEQPTADWMNDDQHGYMIKGGKVIHYE